MLSILFNGMNKIPYVWWYKDISTPYWLWESSNPPYSSIYFKEHHFNW